VTITASKGPFQKDGRGALYTTTASLSSSAQIVPLPPAFLLCTHNARHSLRACSIPTPRLLASDDLATRTGFDDRGVFSDLGVCELGERKKPDKVQASPNGTVNLTPRPRPIGVNIDKNPDHYTCEARCGSKVHGLLLDPKPPPSPEPRMYLELSISRCLCRLLGGEWLQLRTYLPAVR
jgi:hypothetical protein